MKKPIFFFTVGLVLAFAALYIPIHEFKHEQQPSTNIISVKKFDRPDAYRGQAGVTPLKETK